MSARSRWSLWSRWVLANSLAELVGLGATFALGVGIFSGVADSPGVLPAIVSAALMTGSGAIEGLVVGYAQWRAMHAAFPALPRRSWILATIYGALVAWFLGSIPMTIASLAASGQEQAAQEPPAAMMLLMAAGMGAVAGLVLSLLQWRVLRQFAGRAWLWLPANAAAWAVGMPIVFAAVDLAQRSGSLPGGVAVMALSLAITGAVVGAVHGVVLVRLASQQSTGAG